MRSVWDDNWNDRIHSFDKDDDGNSSSLLGYNVDIGTRQQALSNFKQVIDNRCCLFVIVGYCYRRL